MAPMPVLFPKVEDKVIEEELKKLAKMEKMEQEHQKEAPENAGKSDDQPESDLSPTIDFEQFTTVDMRVGTVIKSEKHPKADRLLVFTVDLGFETRTVCAGAAEHYEPEHFVGRRVVVAANLAGRKLRGIESQGMCLAVTGPDGKPHFLEPDPAAANGSRVS